MTEKRRRLSATELEVECGTMLPDKEVVSLLDLFLNVDVALDLAAPIDLAVAANINAAAPIQGAVSANVLSFGSVAQGMATQVTQITQGITGDSTATAPQDASIDQSNDVIDGGTGGTAAPEPAPVTDVPDGTTDGAGRRRHRPRSRGRRHRCRGRRHGCRGRCHGAVDGATGAVDGATGAVDGATGAVAAPRVPWVAPPGNVGEVVDDTTGVVSGVTDGGLLDDGLLNVNVDINLDADMAAPIAGAVAAQANVAAPIDAAVSANVASFGSTATAVAQQSAVINQTIDGNATATADQTADIVQ